MRSTWFVALPFALSSAYAFVACSSSTSTADPADGSIVDSSTVDARTASDSAVGSGNDASSSGGEDSAAPSCTLAADCTGTDVCCGTIPVTGGTIPNCTTGSISTVCTAAASCATKLGTTCSGTQTVRLCTTNADCKESMYGSCCTFGDADGGSLSFCANTFVATFGGGKCQ